MRRNQLPEHDHHEHDHHRHDHNGEELGKYSYHLSYHSHGNHGHFNLTKNKGHHHHCEPCGEGEEHDHKASLAKNDEGCPCCTAAIDLDEVATAINEITKSGESAKEGHEALGKLADFSSGAHWGIFLGISGPLALLGLTAAVRNVKGTLNTREKLLEVITGLEADITKHKERFERETAENKEKLQGVITRLEAFKSSLEYSKFDTNFNLVVPGFINGAASTAVLSSAIVSSPWALPLIALYAGCQTAKNGYDLWRTWNKILPPELGKEVELNITVGTKKINQITASKRKFYSANTAGFAVFTTGAVLTCLAAVSAVTYGAALPVGIALLATGALSTGITNNIWTSKFKPRNGDLGIKREGLDLESIVAEIGVRREIKKLLKNYRDEHLPSKPLKRFGCALLSSLPFCKEKGAELLHKVNLGRVASSNATNDDRLSLLERAINIRKLLKKDGDKEELIPVLEDLSNFRQISATDKATYQLVSFANDGKSCSQVFDALIDLGLEAKVLDRFIKNAIIKSHHDHDTSIKTKEQFLEKLAASNLFEIDGEKISFKIEELQENHEMRKAFMSSAEEYLLFDYVEELKYEQYGLNDFYWSLSKQIQKEEKTKNASSALQQEIRLEDDDLALNTLLAGDGYFPKVTNPIFEEDSETSSQCSGSLSRASGAKLRTHHCSHHHHHQHHHH